MRGCLRRWKTSSTQRKKDKLSASTIHGYPAWVMTGTQRRGRKSRRRTFVIFATIAALALTAVVGAQWLATGNGNAKARAGSLQNLIVTPSTAYVNAGDLYPGGTGSAYVTVQNPAANPDLRVQMVLANGPVTSDNAQCQTDGHGVQFTDANYNGSGPPLPSGSTISLVVADAVTMSGASANSCQNQTFTIPVTVKAQVLDGA